MTEPLQGADTVVVPVQHLAFVLHRYEAGDTRNDAASRRALTRIYQALGADWWGGHWRCRECGELYGACASARRCCTRKQWEAECREFGCHDDQQEFEL